jgi:6-phosphofructokinase 1
MSVLIDRTPPITRITLNRPDTHNAFDETLIAQLTEAFESLREDAATRVVVLQGAGKSFCAGADLHWMGKMVDYSFAENLEDARRLARMFEAIDHCPKPVVGRVHGAAMGGGAGLVAVCDVAVATPDARFAFSEVKLGLIPAVIAPYVVRKIGYGNARALLHHGRTVRRRDRAADWAGASARACRPTGRGGGGGGGEPAAERSQRDGGGEDAPARDADAARRRTALAHHRAHRRTARQPRRAGGHPRLSGEAHTQLRRDAMSVKRIGVLTSGGDSPGMNAAIRAVTRAALYNGLEVYGIKRGFAGLLNEEIEPMSSLSVGGIINRGGTILRSARCEEFKTPEGLQKGAAILDKYGIDALAIIGGDGSMRGGVELSRISPVKVMGLPGTIDNDIPGTDYSIGFDTAVNTALEAIDKVRDTAYSHERVFVIEVMGRHKGFIALEVGLAGGAEAILIPEVPYDLVDLLDKLRDSYERGKRSSIIVVAEGAARAEDVKKFLQEHTPYHLRALVLGHMQRGGSPTAFDRVLATQLGVFAVQRLLDGHTNEMVGVEGGRLVAVPIEYIHTATKTIDLRKLEVASMMAI